VDTMFDKVGQLQRPPFHPKWKEMAPRATVSGWTRFKAAQEWLDRNMPLPPGAAAASGAAPALAASPPSAPAAALAPQEPRDPLYREFLEWRASRAKATTNR
jgi:branched-chain amino acid transport system substrate-binding protein